MTNTKIVFGTRAAAFWSFPSAVQAALWEEFGQNLCHGESFMGIAVLTTGYGDFQSENNLAPTRDRDDAAMPLASLDWTKQVQEWERLRRVCKSLGLEVPEGELLLVCKHRH